MSSKHKMVVIVASVALLAFMVWAGLVRDLTSSEPKYEQAPYENAQRMREPTMEGPRGAIPATSPATWVLPEDYPNIALQGGIEGRTSVTVEVSAFGEVSSCEITTPSGYTELDDRVCNAISTRAKFYPALDRQDNPTKGSYTASVRWQIAD